MGLRDAVSQSWVLTTMAIAFAGWSGYHAVQALVLSENLWAFAGSSPAVGDSVGTNVVGGIAGVLVLTAFLALLVVLFGELEEAEPAPDAWPPEE